MCPPSRSQGGVRAATGVVLKGDDMLLPKSLFSNLWPALGHPPQIPFHVHAQVCTHSLRVLVKDHDSAARHMPCMEKVPHSVHAIFKWDWERSMTETLHYHQQSVRTIQRQMNQWSDTVQSSFLYIYISFQKLYFHRTAVCKLFRLGPFYKLCTNFVEWYSCRDPPEMMLLTWK